MDQEELEVQDHISINENDDCSKDSDGVQLDSNGNTFAECESLVANEFDEVATNALDNSLDDVIIPKVGMVFATVEEAYVFYNYYARMIGFSVRKQRTNKSRSDPTKIQLQSLCCSCEGFYTMVKPPKKKRKEKRFGCKALFEISLISDNNYMLTKFIAEHNHELVPPENSHLLRSQRKSKPSPIGVINKVQESILQQSEIRSHVFAEGNGAQISSSDHSHCNNAVEQPGDEFLTTSDAQSLLDYFKLKKRENKHFFYSFQINGFYQIRGVFFCDAKSRRDYGLFGDVVCFDTSFRTKDYNMVCVLIFGVNGHGQTTLFGCGMLNRETVEDFVWLFNTHLGAMGGKKPNTIFTNHSVEIVNAISAVFPETNHESYPWYIYQNATNQLTQVSIKFQSFAQRFKECIFSSETVEEFENGWDLMLEEYGLKDNECLQGLYESRQTWVQVYRHGHFCAGMTTLQRSESINKFSKTFFGSPLTFREFIDQYAKAMTNRREKEKEAENETLKTPILLSNWAIEREAVKEYTNRLFYSFQGEYKLTLDQRLHLERDNGAIRTYRVTEMEGRKRSHLVTYNQSDTSVLCSCRKFEFHGFLCSHALKVFRELEFTSLPSQYCLKRWTKGATDEVVCDSCSEAIYGDIDPLATARYSKLSRIAQRIVAKGAKSTAAYSLAKSGMLAIGAKMEAFSISEEEPRRTSQNTSGTNYDSVSSSDEDTLLRGANLKRHRGQPDRKVKSNLENKAVKSVPSNQNGSKEAIAAMPQMTGGPPNMFQPSQGLFGLPPHPSQMPPWFLPYSFMGFPDPRYRPIFPKLNMPQQAPLQTPVPQRLAAQVVIPRPLTSSLPSSSTS